MANYIERPLYLEAIRPFIDMPLVKILSGVRRCGKSTVLQMIRDELLKRGVSADHIISRQYTQMDMPTHMSAKQMYDDLTEQMSDSKRYYLLLDEIQEIDGWERAINSLLEGLDVDIYVTGSNSKLM